MRFRVSRRAFLFVIPALAVYVASHLLPLRGVRAESALPSYGRVPAFALVDQRGRPFTAEMLQGKIWIADFVFTRCAGQCPMMQARMASLAKRLPHQPGVELVSFTVDPAWDTPEVLAKYAAGLGPSPMPWHFVTGQEAELTRVCQEGFHLSSAGGGPVDEPITHSVRLVLVDRTLTIRGYYDATEDAALRQLQRDLERLLRG